MAMLAALVLRAWVWPLNSGFWLDETLIRAMIHAPLRDVLSRSLPWSQSALFNFIEWLAYHSLPGSMEFRLRIVSVLASAIAVTGVFKIGHRFIDREAGIISALFFVALPQVCEQACNARPYALAMCAQVWGLYFLFDAMNAGRSRSIFWWTALSAITIYLHVFFAFSFIIEVVFAVAACLCDRRAKLLRTFVIAILLVLAALVPLTPQILLVWRGRALLSISWPVTVTNLAIQIIPFVLLPALLVVILECWCGKLSEFDNHRVLWLAAVMLLGPAIALFSFSKVSGNDLFLPRYLAVTFPACAILWGTLVSRIAMRGQRYMAAMLVLFASCAVLAISGQQPSGGNEDWRSAGQQIPRDSGVLLYSSLVETKRLDWLTDPSRWEYLSAPLNVYRRDIAQTQTLLLPFFCNAKSRAYVSARLDQFVRVHRTVALEVRGNLGSEQWVRAVTETLAGKGITPTRISQHGTVKLLIFRPIRSS
jgi:uncharacterized membrane protein